MSLARSFFFHQKTGQPVPALQRPPVLSSESAPWQNLTLRQHTGGPIELTDVVPLWHVLVVQLNTTAVRDLSHGSECLPAQPLAPGQVAFMPAMNPYSVRSPETGEFVVLFLDPRFVLCAANGLVSADGLDFLPQSACDDPLLRAGVLALRDEVADGSPGGRAYAESIAGALSVHLVRRYSVQKAPVRPCDGGLTPSQLRRSIDFIQAHLPEGLSLQTLAGEVHLSPFHFARLFKKSLGLAPHQYLIRCRVELAKSLLLRSKSTITDVAVEVGFCDQSHLAAHFKRIYGVTPRAFVKQRAVCRPPL
jgi:AraC family transcriptional regulator